MVRAARGEALISSGNGVYDYHPNSALMVEPIDEG